MAKRSSRVAYICVLPLILTCGFYQKSTVIACDVSACYIKYKQTLARAEKEVYHRLTPTLEDRLFLDSIRIIQRLKTQSINDICLGTAARGDYFTGALLHTLLEKNHLISRWLSSRDAQTLYAALPILTITVYAYDEYFVLPEDVWFAIRLATESYYKRILRSPDSSNSSMCTPISSQRTDSTPVSPRAIHCMDSSSDNSSTALLK